MEIRILTTGGSIDKAYSARASDFVVDEPAVRGILDEAGVALRVEIEPLLRKDSLELTDDDRVRIRARVIAARERCVVITHGTDTLDRTARALLGVEGKVVVLTGAMQPAAFKRSDAAFNVGCAVAAAQLLPDGVYVAMNGRVLPGERVRKDAELGRFVEAPAAGDAAPGETGPAGGP